MKRIFQILCLVIASLGLTNCTAYVDDVGYASSRPGYYNRGRTYSHHPTYYGSSRTYNRHPAHYSSRSTRDRHDRDRHDHDGRDSRYSRSSVNTRVRADVGVPVPLFR